MSSDPQISRGKGLPLLRNITRFWTANDGCLVFEIIFDRAWRAGDLDPPAVAIVRCASSLDERHEVAIYEDRPSWFAVDFSSGYHVHGTLRQIGDIRIDGTPCLTIFADIYYRQPGQEHLFHFDGGMVACPSVALTEQSADRVRFPTSGRSDRTDMRHGDPVVIAGTNDNQSYTT
ncbi:hypothetical protein D9M73_90130 [compost metagenome]